MIINEKIDFCRQYQNLQLEKPSGVEVEIPVHKAMAMGLIGLNPSTHLRSVVKPWSINAKVLCTNPIGNLEILDQKFLTV